MKNSIQITNIMNKFLQHHFFGLVFFLLTMYYLFYFIINIGNIGQIIFQDLFNVIYFYFFFVLEKYFYIKFHISHFYYLFLEGSLQGIRTLISFIPILFCLFFSLLFLERCGYMYSVYIIIKKIMSKINLPADALIPIIISFGCNVPAIISTKSLKNKNERILTIMMIPFISCGARLAIYLVFVSIFFPKGGEKIIFFLYLLGIVIAIFTGYVFKNSLINNNYEVKKTISISPIYIIPNILRIATDSIKKILNFIKKVGLIIIPFCIVINVLSNTTLYVKKLDYNSEKETVIKSLGKSISPIFAPIGIEKNNWEASVALITGIVAKEVIIGTLNTLYKSEDMIGKKQNYIFHLFELETDIKNDIIKTKIFNKFNSNKSAFSYLLFILLYFPCISVLAVIFKELNLLWAFISIMWSTVLSYSISIVFYQFSTLLYHPVKSISWIFLIIVVFFMIVKTNIMIFNKYYKKHNNIPIKILY